MTTPGNRNATAERRSESLASILENLSGFQSSSKLKAERFERLNSCPADKKQVKREVHS